jgi:Protein of unknown function, DUF547
VVTAVVLSVQALKAQSPGAPATHPPALVQTPGAPSPTVDHSAYDALLKRYVRAGHVDYAGFAKDPSFARYLASLNGVRDTVLDTPERMAFWINVYNAFTIQRVAQAGETQSIRNVDKTFGVLKLKGPWSTPFVRAAGRTLTLDDVAHHILRKEFSDPRIHFALVYAAMGSPPLRSEAYRGATLDAQLEDQGRRFLSDSTKNHIVVEGRTRIFVLSPIFTYYRTDFGATRADMGRFLAHWFPPEHKERMERGTFMTSQTSFDWTLNSQARAADIARRDSSRQSPVTR